MYCRYCGKELPNDSNFCPNCGARLKEGTFGIKNWFIDFYHNHKVLSRLYLLWLVINVFLLLAANPRDNRFGRRTAEDVKAAFFPFNDYGVDSYDISELFAYVILLPLFIWGIGRIVPYIKRAYKNWEKRYNQWKESNATKRGDYQANILAYKAEHKEETIVEPVHISSVPEEVAIPEQQKMKVVSEETDIKGESGSDTDVLQQEVQPQDKVPLAETEEEVKKMPLLSRFVGSIIDKIFILIVFVVGFTAISPYGAPGKMGTYIGLRNTPLELYEYIDKSQMNSYGTYNDGVSQYYQDMERLANDPPHIGTTLELDMSITFTFIILNIVFYILFESILSASPGKRMLGGIILDSADDKIGFGKALTRGLCGGVLMAGTYFLLHLQGGLTNTVVVVVFFLLLDLPVLFTKKSLLDLCTGTTYAKR